MGKKVVKSGANDLCLSEKKGMAELLKKKKPQKYFEMTQDLCPPNSTYQCAGDGQFECVEETNAQPKANEQPPPPPQQQQQHNVDVSKWSVAELKAYCKQAGIKGVSKEKKKWLVIIVEGHMKKTGGAQQPPPKPPPKQKAPPKQRTDFCADKTKNSLLARATDLQIRGRYRMSREELCREINGRWP